MGEDGYGGTSRGNEGGVGGSVLVLSHQGQRHVFKRDFSQLPQAVQEEYNRLKISGGLGKMAKMDAIVLRATHHITAWSGSLATSDVDWADTISKIETNYKQASNLGYSHTEIVGMLGKDGLEEG